ncbi:hypothetical protein H6P81_000669 [Aristolochia fimbriata]|uniref:Uncharacterized protein n=1 Tax=Aristolochia fimbriata TaxID=158543 RepID=A0AAV7F7W7_ARIFI|nr:hypothetical protein H6P81_000669 [Aristolochia fimbriata]
MEPYELPSSSSPLTPRRHGKLYRSRSSSQSSSSPPLFPSPPRASSYSLNPHHQYAFTSSPSLSSLPSFPAIDVDDRTHTCVSSVQKSDGGILSMAISGRLVYTGSPSNAIRVWRLPELTECGQLKTKARMVRALSVSDKYVFAAYGDAKIRVWRRSSTSMVTTHVRIATNPTLSDYLHRYLIGRDQRKHSGNVSSLDTSYSGNLLYSASGDTTVKVWQIPDLKCIETIQAHTRAVNALVTGPEGVLYTASEDSTIRVWQWNSLEENGRHSLTLTLSAKSSPVKALSLTKDGSVLYAGCTDGCVYYWLRGLGSSHLQYGGALQGHYHAVMCLASVSDHVVSGSADSTCRVWARGIDGEYNCVAVLEGHRGPIRCVVAFRNRFSRDDDQNAFMVCTASMDGALKLWRIADGETTATTPQADGGDYFKLICKKWARLSYESYMVLTCKDDEFGVFSGSSVNGHPVPLIWKILCGLQLNPITIEILVRPCKLSSPQQCQNGEEDYTGRYDDGYQDESQENKSLGGVDMPAANKCAKANHDTNTREPNWKKKKKKKKKKEPIFGSKLGMFERSEENVCLLVGITNRKSNDFAQQKQRKRKAAASLPHHRELLHNAEASMGSL